MIRMFLDFTKVEEAEGASYLARLNRSHAGLTPGEVPKLRDAAEAALLGRQSLRTSIPRQFACAGHSMAGMGSKLSRVDIVGLGKMDRLTRSPTDFSRIFEAF